MKRNSLLLSTVVAIVAALFVLAHSHQAHADPTAITGTARAAIYVRGTSTDRNGTNYDSSYYVNFPANDLADARKRFMQEFVEDGVYAFTSHDSKGDHVLLIERTQVLRTEITMK